MPIFRDYLERARSIEEMFPAQPTVLRRGGLMLLSLLAAGETRPWESFPQVESAEVMRTQSKIDLTGGSE